MGPRARALHGPAALRAALTDASADPVVVIDAEGAIRYINPATVQILGLPGIDLEDFDVFEAVHPDDVVPAMARFAQVLENPGTTSEPVDVRLRDAVGGYRSLEVVATNCCDDPDIAGIVLNLRETTRRVAAEQARAATEALLHHSFETNPVGLGLATVDGELIRVNPAMLEMVGCTEETLIARLDDACVDEAARREELALLGRLYAGEIDSFVAEKRLDLADGSAAWGELTLSLVDDPSGDGFLVLGQLRDCSEQKALREELSARSLQDPLTDLANRSLFEDRVAHALDTQRRSGIGFALLFLDLDDFKVVNDEFGHASGDEALRMIGDRLRNRFRSVDTVSRFGGDEFAVLIEDVGPSADAHDRCEEVLALVAVPMDLDGREVVLEASVGLTVVAPGPPEPRECQELLADADLAMYSAKLAGKGEWRSFEPSMRSIEKARSEIRQALRSGVTNGSVELHYQPVIELESGMVVGLEALVRWRHPERGLLGPGQFLAEAEETGASVAIGHQVLDAVAGHRQRWLDDADPVADLPIAINMSARELREPTLVDRFAELVDVGRFRAGHLIVEVAEPAVDGAVDHAVRVLTDLQALGVDVALDDFGAGRASVTYLTRIRADYAKLERRLSSDLIATGGDDRMMRALVALCREIEVVPVAEGIEDPNQAALVRDLGIRLGQGYLFSRPLPVDAITAVVHRRGAAPVAAG